MKENEGTAEFAVGWLQGIFKRINSFRGKSMTAKPLIGLSLIKETVFSFYKEIYELVKWFNIPKELVINNEQAPLRSVLVSSYTMVKKGNQCVLVAGTTDYRQITGTFGVNLS